MAGYDPNAFRVLSQGANGGWNFDWGGDSAINPSPFMMNGTVAGTGEGFRVYDTPGVQPQVDKPWQMGGLGAGQWAQMGLQGLGAGFGIWNGLQANKIAKQQLAMTREFGNANLNNQIKTYNTALEDRARTRAVMEGRSEQSADDYIAANRLTR